MVRSFVVLSVTVVATGCGVHLGDSTSGEQGVAEFQYSGWSCLFGCTMDTPLLVGTEQKISVAGAHADDEGVTATSTDPAVASFAVHRSCDCEQSSGSSMTAMNANADGTCPAGFQTKCENTVTVDALTPGQAGLQLHTKAGTLLDRTTVRVDRAGSVTLHDNEGNEVGPSLSMRQGDDMLISAHLLDSTGARMLADEGVVWHVAGTAVASGSCLLCTSDETSLGASEPGRATVTMSAAGVRSSFVVSVER